jgi:hypothetical protein
MTPYKIFVRVSVLSGSGCAVHTDTIEFNSEDDAEYALVRLNQTKGWVYQEAIPLYRPRRAYVELCPTCKDYFKDDPIYGLATSCEHLKLGNVKR